MLGRALDPRSDSKNAYKIYINLKYVLLQGVVTPIDSVQTPATGVKNWVKQSKPKIWKIKRSKAHRKLEKVKGQAQ